MNLEKIEQIAKKAGMEALKIYNQDFSIEYKDDNSPLTEADKVSNEIICSELSKIANYPILSEENKNNSL
jgi:3'(2'), 5'-bisphosphate nucleotidase